MAKTHKVQVTLEQEQYERLEEIAEREGKALAAVVRESIVRYCLEPAERRRRRRALEMLTEVEAPAPEDYADWEREYSRAKGTVDREPRASDDDD